MKRLILFSSAILVIIFFRVIRPVRVTVKSRGQETSAYKPATGGPLQVTNPQGGVQFSEGTPGSGINVKFSGSGQAEGQAPVQTPDVLAPTQPLPAQEIESSRSDSDSDNEIPPLLSESEDSQSDLDSDNEIPLIRRTPNQPMQSPVDQPDQIVSPEATPQTSEGVAQPDTIPTSQQTTPIAPQPTSWATIDNQPIIPAEELQQQQQPDSSSSSDGDVFEKMRADMTSLIEAAYTPVEENNDTTSLITATHAPTKPAVITPIAAKHNQYLNTNDARTAFPRVRYLLATTQLKDKNRRPIPPERRTFNFQDILGKPKDAMTFPGPQEMHYPQSYTPEGLQRYRAQFKTRINEIITYLQNNYQQQNPAFYNQAIVLLQTTANKFLDLLKNERVKLGIGEKRTQKK